MSTVFTTDEKLMLFEIRRAILGEYYPRAKLDIEALMEKWNLSIIVVKPNFVTKDNALLHWDNLIVQTGKRATLLHHLYAQVYYLEEQCQNQS